MAQQLIMSGTLPDIQRSSLIQEDLVAYPVGWEAFKLWDARVTNPVAAAANDDMGLVTGTYGSGAMSLQGADSGGTSVTNKIGFVVRIPAEYNTAQRVKIRIRAKMAATADTVTIDASAYEMADGVAGGDLVTTAATSINSATYANYDFDVTPTTLAAGDMLDIVLTMVATSAAGTGKYGIIERVSMLYDIKG